MRASLEGRKLLKNIHIIKVLRNWKKKEDKTEYKINFFYVCFNKNFIFAAH